MKQFRKIVVTTDFSRLSTASFGYAHTIASICGGEILLLHVINGEAKFPVKQVDATPETVYKDAEAEAHSELSRLIAEHFRGKIKVTPRVTRGVPHSEILRISREEHADCIVLATHGRTGLARVLIGSVAEKVIRHSFVPVLTVTPKAIQRAAQGMEEASLAAGGA